MRLGADGLSLLVMVVLRLYLPVALATTIFWSSGEHKREQMFAGLNRLKIDESALLVR